MKGRITLAILTFFGALSLAMPSAAKAFVPQNTYTLERMTLMSSEPLPGVDLNAPPSAVTLYFSAAVDPSNSQLSVYDPHGNKISSNPIIAGTNMSVTLKLPSKDYAGAYSVQWVVSCLCSDTNNRPTGVYNFGIN